MTPPTPSRRAIAHPPAQIGLLLTTDGPRSHQPHPPSSRVPSTAKGCEAGLHFDTGLQRNISIATCAPVANPAFEQIELICIIVFSVEYLLRLFTVHAVRWTWPENGARMNPQPSGLSKTWRFFVAKMNLIDFVAIAPFYLGKALEGGVSGLAVLRVLRLARVFRIFKLGKYSSGLQLFARVMDKSLTALYLLVFFLAIGVVLFGSMLFFAEQGSYSLNLDATGGARMQYMRTDVTGFDLEPSPFQSIPQCFWWVLVTTTTVGYGDMYPTTLWGKVVGILVMHAGLIVLAMPITIIGTNFATEYQVGRWAG